MTAFRLRKRYWLTAVFFLHACSTQPQFVSTLQTGVDANARLIGEQQGILLNQNNKLDEINGVQVGMVDALNTMQKQLQALQKSNNERGPQKNKPGQVKRELVSASINTVDNVVKTVIGREEWVWLDLLSEVHKARIDTGTRTSSIGAKNIQPFERDGARWVRFSLNIDSEEKIHESPLARQTRVRTSAGEDTRRHVVRIGVRMGGMVEETEFILTGRQDTEFPVLLGRDFLRDIVVVDVAQKFTQPKPDLKSVLRK